MINQHFSQIAYLSISFFSKARQKCYEVSQVLAYSLILSHLTFIPYVHAGPVGGQITGGTGSISQTNLSTIINQTSGSMAINWDSYNLGANERVQYIQPGSSSLSLNRILSNNGSQIHGRIDANGTVILVNPNGVFFGANSQINVGGLIASGLDISPTDFMNGNYIFNEVLGTDGAVINSGLINASLGGNVTLIGKQIKNEGVINAHLGAVNMAVGKQAVLTFDQQGLIGVKVTKEILQNELGIDPALINSGEINAESGRVLLTASVSRDVFSQAVNTGNIEQATSVLVNEDGSFSLGGGADVLNNGVINVSSIENNNAGDVVIIGENITHTGIIRADVNSGNAGNIELHAKNKTELREDALISAQARASGSGGDVKVLGDKIGLFDNAQINASGANAGGRVLVGGDRQGLNNHVRNADFLFLGEQTRIFADALVDGNGGKVITYANDTGRFYGALYARGGELGGDGGFIETSGKKGFAISNAPDVSASAGQGGLWLIDPYDITITGADLNLDTSGTNPTIYSPDNSVAGATVNVDTIRAGLVNGSVEIKTVAGAAVTGEDGDIIFAATLDYNDRGDFNSTGSNTLTLNADGAIIFFANAEIKDTSNSGDSLNINLFANDEISLLNNVTIDTQGGDFIVGGAGGNTPTSFTSTGATIDTSGRFDTDGGDINITSSGSVVISTLTTAGGDTGTSNNSATDRVGRAGGDVIIEGTSVVIGGAIDTSGSGGTYDTSGSGDNGQNGGSGGLVNITATTGSINVNSITTSGGAAAGDNDSAPGVPDFGNGGDAGTIDLSLSTVLGNEINLSGNLIAQGALSYIDGTDVNSRQGAGGAITLSGDTILTSSVIVDTDGLDNGSSGANISFSGNIDQGVSNQTLTLDAGTADISVTGSIGNAAELQAFTIEEANLVDIGAITTLDGGVSISANTMTLRGNIDTIAAGAIAGNLTLNGNVVLGNSLMLNTNAVSTDGIISISGDINADLAANSRTLIMGAGEENITLNNVGNSEALRGLFILTANTTNLNGEINTREGGVSIVSSAINLGGDINTDKNIALGIAGSVQLAGTTQLTANVAIDTSLTGLSFDGAVVFNGTVDAGVNNRALSITAGSGNVTFTQAAGVNQALQSLIINSANSVSLKEVRTRSGGINVNANAITLGGNILTNIQNDAGDVTFFSNTDIIALTSSVLIDSVGSNTDGFINLTGNIDADAAINDRVLTLATNTENITIDGDIGVNDALLGFNILDANDVSIDGVNTQSGGVQIDADTVALGGNINTTRNIAAAAGVVDIAGSDSNPGSTSVTLDSNVTITTNTPVNSEVDAAVSIAGDINNNNSGTAFDLNINAGFADLTLANVGAAQAIKSFTVASSNTTTVGAIETGGVVDISASSIADNAIQLLGDISTNNNGVVTAGDVTFTGAVELGNSLSINTNATNSGAVTFENIINADVAASGRALVINAGTADIDFQDTLGVSRNIQGLTISSAGDVQLAQTLTRQGGVDITANSMTLSGDIDTGAQVTAGNVVLNVGGGTVALAADVSIDTSSASDAAINITGNVTATTAGAGAESLILNAGTGNTADITIIGDVGSAFALQEFTINNADNVSIDGVNTRDGGVTITTATTVGLGGDIDTTFGTDAGLVNITAPINLEANTSITTNHVSGVDASIVLNEVDGNSVFLLDAGSADITFSNDLGGTTAIAGLTVISAATTNVSANINTRGNGVNIISGDINLGGDISTVEGGTAGSVFLNGSVNLLTSSNINTNASSDGSITFVGNVNGANDLIIDAGAAIVDFQSAIGNTVALESLSVINSGVLNLNSVLTRSGGINAASSGTINLFNNLSTTAEASNAGSIMLAGNVLLNNDVFLNTNKAVDASVTITGTVDSSGGARNFIISSGNADVDLQSALGSSSALGSLDINSSGSLGTLNLNSVTTAAGNIRVAANLINLQGNLDTTDGVVLDVATGNITIDGEVNLAGATTLNTDAATSLTDGLITFTNRVSGAQNLDVISGQANVQFFDTVGQNSADAFIGVNRFFVNNGVTNAGIASLNTVVTGGGGINVTASNINLQGDLSSDNTATAGDINLNGDVRVANDIRIDSGSGTSASIVINGDVLADSAIQNRLITFSAGDQNLTVNGSLGTNSNSLGGVIVEDAATASFDIIMTQTQGVDVTASNIELGGNINTDRGVSGSAGAVNLDGNVTLVSNVVIDTNASGTDADLVVTGTIDADSTANNRVFFASVGNGNIDIQGDVGTGFNGVVSRFVALSNSGIVNVANIISGSSGIGLEGGTINLAGNLSSNGNTNAGSIVVQSTGNLNLLNNINFNSNAAGIDQLISIGASTIEGNNNALSLNSGNNSTSISTAVTNVSQFDILQSQSSILNGVNVNGAGSLNINANNGVSLTGDYTTGTGQIIINADVDADKSGLISLNNNSSFTTVDNIISFTAATLTPGTGVLINSGIAGQVLFNSTGDISLGNSVSGMNITNNLVNAIVASNVQLTAADALHVDGANVSKALSFVTTNGDINFTGAASNFDSLLINTLNDVLLGADVISANSVDVSAANIVSNGAGSFTSTNAGIALTGNLTGTDTLNLNALNGNVDLQATTITNLDSLTIDADNIQFAAATPVVTLNDINLTVRTTGAQYEQLVDLTSTNGSISFNTSSADLVFNASTTLTAQNAITLSADNGDVGLSAVSVGAGSINVNALNGAITDNNSDQNNLTASSVVLRADSGIGTATDAIETVTGQLDVINNGAASGTVDIANTGDVLITNLVNNGNIGFTNTSDVTIDHIDAGFTTGLFQMDISDGAVFGIDRGSIDFLTVPDITADSAFITVNGEFGTFERPIVLKLNSEFFLASTVSSTFFLGGPPPVNNDTSALQISVFDSINSVSGQQLIEVESIADIDPAIFTELRNYNEEDVAIRLPRDQVFEDELDIYDR